MKSPFDDIDNAFAPLYTDEVKVILKSGNEQNLKCIITSSITDDPIDDGAIDSDKMLIDLTFRRADYKLIGDLKRGDKLVALGKNFSVMSAKYDALFGYIVTAREC